MGLHLLYGAALFGVSVQALAFEAPQPTDPFQALPQNGWSPKPTPGPDAHALLRRQNTLPEGYLLAPDNTCGFISANPSMCPVPFEKLSLGPWYLLTRHALKNRPMHALEMA
jgi:hypothetical protein